MSDDIDICYWCGEERVLHNPHKWLECQSQLKELVEKHEHTR